MAPTASEIELDGVLSRLRLDLSRKGHHAMIILRRALYQIRAGSNTLNYAEFEQALSRVGLFMPLPQLALLYRHFDLEKNRSVSIEAFMQALVGQLSPVRLQLVQGLYQSLARDPDDAVNVSELMARFHPEFHPKVLAQDKTASAIRLEIVDLIQTFSEGSRISAQQFHDLFRYLGASIPLHDAAFADVIHHAFRSESDSLPLSSSDTTDTGPIDSGYLQSVRQVLKEKIRQKTRGQESESLTLTRVFRHFDVDDSGQVNFQEWTRALERFGILMPEKESRALFAQHDPGRTGHIRYNQFVHDLYHYQYQHEHVQ